MDNYWFSYNTYLVSAEVGGSPSCIISFVLEDEASFHFSGIRLLIVHKPSERLSTLRIEDWVTPTTRFRTPRGSQTTHREALIRRCDAAQSSKRLLTGAARPVCTFVFELIDRSDERYNRCTLVPHSKFEAEQLREVRIAYDFAYPCNSTHRSIVITLNTSQPFHRTPLSAYGMIDLNTLLAPIHAHSVRIVPFPRRQQQFPSLPSWLLCSIVKLALGGKPKGWRKALLSFGLVCKSWALVLDLAVAGFDEIDDEDKPGVVAVARALELRPERAAAIRIFSPWVHEGFIDPSGEASLDKWHAVLTILTHATSVETVDFSSIHASIARDLVRLLQKLRKVRVCKFKFRNGTTRFSRGHALSMDEVQTCIADWEQLESLGLMSWRDTRQTPDAPPPSRLACKIRNLTLEGAKITGPQLMLFASGPTAYLKELRLTNVKDVPNCDFLSFLNAVAPTLSRLVVLESTIHRITDEEERAIDAAMPAMGALEHLYTNGDCVSALAIARKAPARPRVGNTAVHGSIIIRTASLGMSFEDVTKAVKMTMWETVSVTWAGAPDWDKAQAESTKRAASERGVTFECRVGYPNRAIIVPYGRAPLDTSVLS
ncbi:hypothetical protein FPV67DRAFT_1665695 [Lyophyllum atratum]|nr:hypothetical protein FPV67DRAFT_1665695 [Lyophyllum atratum]